MSLNEAAALSGYSRVTVWRAVKRGDVLGELVSPRKMRISVPSITEWSRNRKVKAIV